MIFFSKINTVNETETRAEYIYLKPKKLKENNIK